MDLKKRPNISVLLGLPFHNLTALDALKECKAAIESRKPTYFVTANLDFAAQAYTDEELKGILFHAGKVFCDGQPLVWLSRLFKSPLAERVSGADLVPKLLHLCELNEYSVYFLGPNTHTLKQLIDVIKKQYPGLKIAGQQSPPIGSPFDWDNISIAGEIKKAKPDLLLVSLGFPKQERWIYMYHKKTGVPLSIGTGAAVEFMTGNQKRAPKWIQKNGLEWFWRLCMNPVKMYKRYARDLFFLARVTLKHHRTLKKSAKGYVPRRVKDVVNSPTHYTITWTGKVSRERIALLQMPENFNKHVVCNCSDVTFIDSAGLGHLAYIARQCHKKGNFFCILKASPIVTKAIKTMRLEKQIPLMTTATEVNEALTRHSESLVLTKDLDNEKNLRVKPLVNLNMETIGKIESVIYDTVPALEEGASVLVDLEKIEFMDSMAVAALISIKNNLKKIDMTLCLIGVNGHPLKLLRSLKLDSLLISQTRDASIQKSP